MTTRKSPSDHAKDFADKKKVGNDGQMYISKKDKNGVYKWVLYNPIKYKSTPEEYYSQFEIHDPVIHDVSFITKAIPKLIADLKKIGVNLFVIKWSKKLVDQGPEFEYEYFQEDNGNKLNEGNYIFFSERSLYFASTKKKGVLSIQHSLKPEVIDKFNQIFKKYFPRRTNGFMTNAMAIQVYLKDQKHIKKEKEKKFMGLYIKFKNKKLDTPSKILMSSMNTLIKNKGFVTDCDYVISQGQWYAGLEINVDIYDKVKASLSKMKTFRSEPVESVKII